VKQQQITAVHVTKTKNFILCMHEISTTI